MKNKLVFNVAPRFGSAVVGDLVLVTVLEKVLLLSVTKGVVGFETVVSVEVEVIVSLLDNGLSGSSKPVVVYIHCRYELTRVKTKGASELQ